MALIDVEIDGLTHSIIEVATDESLSTTIAWWKQLKASQRKLSGWAFDWKEEVKLDRMVAGLCIEREPVVQGLIAMEPMSDHMLIHLVESAPHNVGRGKRYVGVPGNLFAFACMHSRQYGFDGAASFFAKTKLIDHYQATLGAIRVGSSQRMIILEDAADRLIELYFKDDDRWNL